jgi:hypothetical protein
MMESSINAQTPKGMERKVSYELKRKFELIESGWNMLSPNTFNKEMLKIDSETISFNDCDWY